MIWFKKALRFANSIAIDFRTIPKKLRLWHGLRYEESGRTHKAYLYLLMVSDTLLDTLLALHQRFFTRNADKNSLRNFGGGYYLDPSFLKAEEKVIYAFGVANSIDFEKEIASEQGCSVFMYDPTPAASEYIQSTDLVEWPQLKFHAVGLWIQDGPIKFYTSKGQFDLSITNLFGSESYIELECKTLLTLMAENRHDRVDILKMDIEGAALTVLASILDQGIRPGQVVFELERPFFSYGANFFDIAKFYRQRAMLFRKFTFCGYRIRSLDVNEFLAVLN